MLRNMATYTAFKVAGQDRTGFKCLLLQTNIVPHSKHQPPLAYHTSLQQLLMPQPQKLADKSVSCRCMKKGNGDWTGSDVSNHCRDVRRVGGQTVHEVGRNPLSLKLGHLPTDRTEMHFRTEKKRRSHTKKSSLTGAFSPIQYQMLQLRLFVSSMNVFRMM